MENFYSFTALRGIQGRRMSYIIQIPLSMVGTLFEQENFSLPVIERKQRTLNKARVNQIAKYLVDNPDSYVLPPLVAQIIGAIGKQSKQRAQCRRKPGWRIKFSAAALGPQVPCRPPQRGGPQRQLEVLPHAFIHRRQQPHQKEFSAQSV